jgi:hypothetical protein
MSRCDPWLYLITSSQMAWCLTLYILAAHGTVEAGWYHGVLLVFIPSQALCPGAFPPVLGKAWKTPNPSVFPHHLLSCHSVSYCFPIWWDAENQKMKEKRPNLWSEWGNCSEAGVQVYKLNCIDRMYKAFCLEDVFIFYISMLGQIFPKT